MHRWSGMLCLVSSSSVTHRGEAANVSLSVILSYPQISVWISFSAVGLQMFWAYETKCQTRFETTSIWMVTSVVTETVTDIRMRSRNWTLMCVTTTHLKTLCELVCVLVKINVTWGVLTKTPDVSQHRCGVHNMIWHTDDLFWHKCTVYIDVNLYIKRKLTRFLEVSWFISWENEFTLL